MGGVDDASSVFTSARVATSANHLDAQEPHESQMRLLSQSRLLCILPQEYSVSWNKPPSPTDEEALALMKSDWLPSQLLVADPDAALVKIAASGQCDDCGGAWCTARNLQPRTLIKEKFRVS